MPNRLVLHINNISTISGAGTAHTVHHTHINKHMIHPKKPQILFDDTPDLDLNISVANSKNVITCMD